MRWLLTWCGVCAALAAPVAAQPQPNLLANSGFEEIGADGKPLQWSFLGKGELVTDGKPAHGGKHYARVRFEDCAIQTVAIEPNTYYFIEGFVRAEDPSSTEVPRVKVYFQTAADKTSLISGGFITKPSYRDWQPFRITLRSPADGVKVAVRLIGQFNGSDWFHFDDVTMRAVPLREWPAAATLPDLNGQTVVVADLEDVWSFALYRVAPRAQAPIDGLLTTAAWSARAQEITVRPPTCDFDLRFGRPVSASWVLIHAISPDEPLGQAALFALKLLAFRLFAVDHLAGAAYLLLGDAGGRIDRVGPLELGQGFFQLAGFAQFLAFADVCLPGLKADAAQSQQGAGVARVLDDGLLVEFERLVVVLFLFRHLALFYQLTGLARLGRRRLK